MTLRKYYYNIVYLGLLVFLVLNFLYFNWNVHAESFDSGINIDNKYNTLSSKDNCSKSFGILRYDYENFRNSDYSKYTPLDVNVGDYIQSISAAQYITSKYQSRILINRDSLKYYNGSPVDMIMNGWYFIHEKNEVFSNKINPIFVAFHINNINEVNNKTIEYLKKSEPIGCRDHYTERFLISKGVKAYFSGCLTTTLDLKYKVDDRMRNNDIIFCDYKFGYNGEIDKRLRDVLSSYNLDNITHITHSMSKDTSHFQRFKAADDILKKYAKAKLVVTTRIHCALPCLALGTPVILVNSYYDFRRYDGLYELLNTIGPDNSGNWSNKINFDSDHKIVNSNLYLEYANKLKSYLFSRLSN